MLPFVLRQTQEHYELVGHCLVSGVDDTPSDTVEWVELILE